MNLVIGRRRTTTKHLFILVFPKPLGDTKLWEIGKSGADIFSSDGINHNDETSQFQTIMPMCSAVEHNASWKHGSKIDSTQAGQLMVLL
jgi:hypothetical protein